MRATHFALCAGLALATATLTYAPRCEAQANRPVIIEGRDIVRITYARQDEEGAYTGVIVNRNGTLVRPRPRRGRGAPLTLPITVRRISNAPDLFARMAPLLQQLVEQRAARPVADPTHGTWTTMTIELPRQSITLTYAGPAQTMLENALNPGGAGL